MTTVWGCLQAREYATHIAALRTVLAAQRYLDSVANGIHNLAGLYNAVWVHIACANQGAAAFLATSLAIHNHVQRAEGDVSETFSANLFMGTIERLCDHVLLPLLALHIFFLYCFFSRAPTFLVATCGLIHSGAQNSPCIYYWCRHTHGVHFELVSWHLRDVPFDAVAFMLLLFDMYHVRMCVSCCMPCTILSATYAACWNRIL